MKQICHSGLNKDNMLRLFPGIILYLVSSAFAAAQKIPVNIPFITVEPRIITDSVAHDTDDPAIWIHPSDRSKSLIIGTDKNSDGALYTFDLQGKIVNVVKGLERPNNVDIAYSFPFNGKLIDIAVVTERLKQRVRVFRLPHLEPIDQGDLVVFDGNPHEHHLVGIIKVSAVHSDGSDVTSVSLPGFPSGLFVTMSEGKTFHYYSWKDIAKLCINGH